MHRDPTLCAPEELARLMRAGDMEALDRVSRCYGDRLLALGRKYCGDADRARDALQDAMLAAGEHLGDYRGDGSVEGWLASMVVNFCRRSRRGRKHDPSLHVDVDDAPVPAHTPSPEERTAQGELLALLGDALQRLDPRDRALLLLADGEGWTAPELAESLGMSPGSVRTRLSRARRALRAALPA